MKIDMEEYYRVCYNSAIDVIRGLRKENLALKDRLFLYKAQNDLLKPIVDEYGKAG